ncbi:MAG: hypothetical protein RIT81_27500 [Deltaproteobacteria bacterium]
MSRWITAALLIPLALSSTGCGILLQSAFGWSTEERRVSEKTHAITVRTQPEGLPVTRSGPDGTKQLGASPVTDKILYEHEMVIESPSTAGLYIGGVLEIVAAFTAFFASAPGDCEDVFVEGCDTNIPLALLGGALMYFGLQDMVIGLVYGLSGDSVKQNRAVDPPTYTYASVMSGKPRQEKRIQVPDSSFANFSFDGTPVAPIAKQAPPPPPPPPPPTTAPPPSGMKPNVAKWVIAVMDVEDVNAGANNGIERGLVRNLGDQLRIFIAQAGVRTVDRSAQERALKDVISEAKSDSYKACYDDSCQIELGKALAATHILRSRITRFGSRCVLNAEMIDLRAEVTVKAASARGDCEAEGFLTMSEEVANSLVQ